MALIYWFFVSNFPCFKAIKFHKLISVRADIGVKIIVYMNHVANDHMIVSSHRYHITLHTHLFLMSKIAKTWQLYKLQFK